MAREPKYGVTLNGWERLLASLEANKHDFPQLDGYRTQLATMLAQVREATNEQAAMAASKQEASKRLKALLTDGHKLATFLRGGIRQQYGKPVGEAGRVRPAAAAQPDPGGDRGRQAAHGDAADAGNSRDAGAADRHQALISQSQPSQ